MCKDRSKKKKLTTNQKKKYSDQYWKEMDYDEPHLMSNEMVKCCFQMSFIEMNLI
jgi:hypothetical protein